MLTWPLVRLSSLALTAVLLASCGKAPAFAPPHTQPPSAVAVDRPGPRLPLDFRLEPYSGSEFLTGESVPFSQLFSQGKPVVLNFFAGLCPPCRAEMPGIGAVSTRYSGQVIILSVDIGPFTGLGTRAQGQALVTELGLRYPTASTPDREVVRAYGVLGMPTTLFLRPDGQVFNKWTGFLSDGKFAELTADLLKHA